MSWIVAMTRPNQEAIASENLRRQGYIHYLPRFLFSRPNKTPLVRPLFPRYMFIFVDQIWYSLLGTRGISKVLMADKGPQAISARVIDELRQREDGTGLIQLVPPPRFTSGARVKAGEGPLMGQMLVYDGMTAHERCRVLVSMLGRKVRVEINERTLVAA